MGLATLAQVLRPIQERFDPADYPQLMVGLEQSDDAAIYRISDDLALIQTLDFFPPVVDDPYTYGEIAAANAMSDVYAMGGVVRMALNIAAFPEDLDPSLLAAIFRGGADKVHEAGGVIAGGHTLIDEEPKYGLSVMGFVHPDAILYKGGARPGDALLLTKPLGTGILLTAAKQQRAGHETGLEAAITSMRRLSQHPAHLARAAGVRAVTDVTGFGLAGHAAEMAEQSAATFVIEAESLPELPDARRFAREGALTGGGERNIDQLGDRVRVAEAVDGSLRDLLYDPQTSGGLLIALAADRAGPGAMTRARAARALVVAAILLVALAACGRDGEEALDLESVDAAALLRAAAERTDEARSFHFLLEHEGGTTQIVRGLSMERAEGDVVGADRLRVEVKASAGPLNLKVEIVVIGDEAWITNPLTGRWEREDISIQEVFDPANGVTAIMRAAGGAHLTGSESVAGIRTYVVEATVDSGDVTLFGEPRPGVTLLARVWIGVDDPLVRRIEIIGGLASGETADLVRRLTLSRFDAEIEIEPPN
jgi:selenide,water dikinase